MNIKERLEKLISGNPASLNAYLREVCKSTTVDETSANMHIHMIRLDGNNRPRQNDFVDYLINQIVSYCIPLSEIQEARKKDQEYNTQQYTSALFRKAEKLFTRQDKSGEVGELILSRLVQSVLGLPQILCKMALKTNPNVHFHGADGIYGGYDEATGKFHMYWGESKLYADIDQAMSDCFSSIKDFLTEEGTGGRKERDISLFRSNMDFSDPELQNVILAYLDPENEEYLKLEYRGVCLIGYNEDSYPTDFSKLEDEIYTQIESGILDLKGKIKTRLKNRAPLDSFVLEVFLVPFANVDDLRDRFISEI